ncbi:MAG: hypothetical protein ACRD2W_10015 [Acidimicrobiales bacterium]
MIRHDDCQSRFWAGDHPAGLFVRCVLWGVATGAAAGGIIGFFLSLLAVGIGPLFLLIGPLAGVIYGAGVALLPAVTAASAITVVIRRRHAHPASPDAVRRDVGIVFAVGLGIVDLGVLIAVVVSYKAAAAGGAALLVLAVVNLSMAPLLARARTSIARAWTGIG